MTTTTPATIDSKKPNTKQELIAANIKLLIEQLDAGHSDALTNYLTAMSRFHNYSFGNVLEIARQMPTATRVAGFWTWKNLGRSVNVGAKGIRAGKAAQGASHRQHHGHSRLESHRGCSSSTPDEARFALRSDTDLPAIERVAVANTGATAWHS